VLALASPRPEPETPTPEQRQPRGAYEWFAAGLRKEAEAGQDAAAEECYRQALGSDPGLAAAHTNLGGICHRRGETGAARAEFEAALALDPEQPEARYNLATS